MSDTTYQSLIHPGGQDYVPDNPYAHLMKLQYSPDRVTGFSIIFFYPDLCVSDFRFG